MVSIAHLDDSPRWFLHEQKLLKKNCIFAEFSILAGILEVQSQFPSLVLVFLISRWRANFLFRMFAFSFL